MTTIQYFSEIRSDGGPPEGEGLSSLSRVNWPLILQTPCGKITISTLVK